MNAQENGVPEPAHLDDLQATDRLLSRLGERLPEPEDLDDEVFAALFGLACDVDEEPAATDAGLQRLREALGERPLYVMSGEDLADDAGTGRNVVFLDDPSWADEPTTRVIDLTGDEAQAGPAEGPAVLPAEEPAGATADEDAAAERPAATVAQLPQRPTVPGQSRTGEPVPEDRWMRALRQLPLPVAAALAIFAVGGGITTAMSGGDPIAPITGVVDQISGGSSPRSTPSGQTAYTSVNQDLVRAQEAASKGHYAVAKRLIEHAYQQLGKAASPEEAAELQRTIQAVTGTLPPAARPTTPPRLQLPPAVAPAPTVPVAPPSAAASPAPQPTNPPTTPPEAEPTPTVPEPTTPVEQTTPPDPAPSTPADEPSTPSAGLDQSTP